MTAKVVFQNNAFRENLQSKIDNWIVTAHKKSQHIYSVIILIWEA